MCSMFLHPAAAVPVPKVTPIIPTVPERAGPLRGWRDVYVNQGPEAWAKAVRQHRKTKGVLLTDTTM
jgi:pyruvate carboxylase